MKLYLKRPALDFKTMWRHPSDNSESNHKSLPSFHRWMWRLKRKNTQLLPQPPQGSSPEAFTSRPRRESVLCQGTDFLWKLRRRYKESKVQNSECRHAGSVLTKQWIRQLISALTDFHSQPIINVTNWCVSFLINSIIITVYYELYWHVILLTYWHNWHYNMLYY